jgi:peptide/nickel transport system permease protein
MARQLSQTPGAKPYDQWVAELKARYGLDTGVVQGYFIQLGNFLTGNFGDSWLYAVPVTEKFTQVIGISLLMGAIALAVELLVGVTLGILAARRQYSLTDYGLSVTALLGISLPAFFFATLLKLIFSVRLGWFDLFGLVGRDYATLSPVGKVLDMAKHLVLPIMTMVAVSAGSLMRFTRTNMLEVLNADYIRTARAKGVEEGRVITTHAFRNTLIPLVTVVGGSLPGLFAGALVTETLFAIPGIGYTAYQAMVAGDIPFSMFYLTFLAAMILLGNLLSDILYALVDPRVGLGQEG